MILSTTQEGRHVDDGDLIRLRDGECPLSEERILRDHLDACATCRENSERFEQLADGFFAAMERVQHPAATRSARQKALNNVPISAHAAGTPPWHGRRSVRAAAVVAAVLALTLTTAPARALVAAGWQAVKTLFVGAPPATAEPQQATSLVSFVPQGDAFLIDFLHTQSRGTLTVVVDTVLSASARVMGSDGMDELIVLQAGLRVRNRTTSAASYELRLPRSLRDIEVRIAGRTVATFSAAGMTQAARWEVDLSNP